MRERILLDWRSVDFCDGIAWYASAAGDYRDGRGKSAQGEDKSNCLDHENLRGGGTFTGTVARVVRRRLGFRALLG
jgi:hypothetical protein